MPTTSITTVFDTFATATIANYQKTLEKNFLEARPVLEILMDKYGHKDTSGGLIWQDSAEYGANATVTMFSGAQPFDQTPSQNAQPIRYTWRYCGGAVSMTKTEMLENRNKAKLFDIFQVRLDACIRSMNTLIAQETFSDGTNFGGQTITGLAAAVSTTPTANPASGNVGGLDATVFNWWQNSATTSAGSFAANGVHGTSNTDLVFSMYNNLTDGSLTNASAIVSAQDVFQFYNQTGLGPVRFTNAGNGSGTLDYSFNALNYMGIPWVWDRLCPSGRVYLLNKDYIHFYTDPDFFFEWSAPLTYPNVLAFTRICGIRMFLCTKARMWHGVLDGFTA